MNLARDIQYLYQHNQILLIDAHVMKDELESMIGIPSNNILFVEFPKSIVFDLFVDPHLSKYRTVVINYHFSVYLDLLISLIKRVCIKRADLKLIIINPTEPITKFFDNPGYLQYYPNAVDVYYLDIPSSNIVQTIIFTIYQIYNSDSGTILVFCSSAKELNQLKDQLKLDSIHVQIVTGNRKPEFLPSCENMGKALK